MYQNIGAVLGVRASTQLATSALPGAPVQAAAAPAAPLASAAGHAVQGRAVRTMQTSLWTSVRAHVRDSRDARAARARLERELASYSTPAELNDLHAILDRYSDQETADIRRILAAHQASPRGDGMA